MRKITCALLVTALIFLSANFATAQTASPMGNSGSFTGALGLTVIDDQSYITINLRPDIGIGKFGVGLNINLLYNTENGAIRHEDWNEDYDWARLIRYVRYGRKGDNFYTKVGTLDAARLGHGFIMNYYTNEASYDQRKIGLVFDLDFDVAGFETVTNNLGRFEIFGARAYVRPLLRVIDIPIIKNLTFGASYVMDVDPDGNRDTNDGTYEYGLDVELPLIDIPMFRTYTYYDWAKIANFGSGSAVGIAADLQLVAGIAEVTARLERRWLGKEFIPSYFNAFYEINRYHPGDAGTIYRIDEQLQYVQKETKGTFGELAGHLLNTIQLVGNYQWYDDPPHDGTLHLAAETKENIPTIALQATYDKMGVVTLKDAFTLDDRSIARFGVGYKVKPYLILFMDYIYTFRYDNVKEKYTAQERFSPRVAFVYNFGI